MTDFMIFLTAIIFVFVIIVGLWAIMFKPHNKKTTKKEDGLFILFNNDRCLVDLHIPFEDLKNRKNIKLKIVLREDKE